MSRPGHSSSKLLKKWPLSSLDNLESLLENPSASGSNTKGLYVLFDGFLDCSTIVA